jgi:hypothetical protein
MQTATIPRRKWWLSAFCSNWKEQQLLKFGLGGRVSSAAGFTIGTSRRGR